MTSRLYTDKTRGTGLLGSDLRRCYSGEVVDDKRHGRGTYTYPNRCFTYEGEYSEGRKHGHGKFTMADGTFYEGTFCNDEMTGQGVKHWANGAHYDGEFLDGEMSGEGMYTGQPGGLNYVGSFFANKFHGRGSWQDTANGDTYEGSFEAHKFHGSGKLVCTHGGGYEGEWKSGKRHGIGKGMNADGDIFEGEWRENFYYQGTWTHGSSGTVYNGAFNKNIPLIAATKVEAKYRPVDIKKPDAPLECGCGIPTGEEISIIVRSVHQVEAPPPSTGTRKKLPKGVEAPTHMWETVEGESKRPITIKLHVGLPTINEEDGTVTFGEWVTADAGCTLAAQLSHPSPKAEGEGSAAVPNMTAVPNMGGEAVGEGTGAHGMNDAGGDVAEGDPGGEGEDTAGEKTEEAGATNKEKTEEAGATNGEGEGASEGAGAEEAARVVADGGEGSESANAAGQEEDAEVEVAGEGSMQVHTRDGQLCLRALRIGERDENYQASIDPGPYSLVFSSHEVVSGYIPITLTGMKAKSSAKKK